MKKLMVALSAVALAFGLRADGQYIEGDDFNEATDLPATLTSTGESSWDPKSYDAEPNTFSYESTIGIPDYFRDEEIGSGKSVAIKTPLATPMDWTPVKGAQNMSGLYFDSLVRFTACDEDAAVPAGSGAKLMVWVKETEAEGATAGSTNLMITAGYVKNSDNELEAKIYDCGSVSKYHFAVDGNDWCRLTIKAKADIGADADSGISGFVVFVNGEKVTMANGTDMSIGVTGSVVDDLNKVDQIWAKNHQLFPSLIPSDATVKGVSFAGQGAIDDICLTAKEPTKKDTETKFALDPVPAIATVNGADCSSVEAINAAIEGATEGAEVILVDNITGALTFGNGAANTLNLGAFTLGGAITVTSGSLAINGTGKVTGDVTPKNGDVINGGTFDGEIKVGRGVTVKINGGEFLSSANPNLVASADFPAGKTLILDESDGYLKFGDKQLFSGGTGTEADPYIMGKDDDLGELRDLVAGGETYAGKFFKQTANLNLAGEVWDGIGKYFGENSPDNCAFEGIYNGNGQAVENVTFARKKYNGFFGLLGGAATVSNLTITVAGIDTEDTETTSYGFGAAVGFSKGNNVLVEDVTVNPAVEGQPSIVGTHNMAGIGARLEGKITLRNCVNNLDISTTYTKIAGICAIASQREATGEIVFEGCVNNGTITGDGLNPGKTDTEAGSDGLAGILGYIEDGVSAGAKPVSFINCANNGTLQHTGDTGTTKACIASILGKISSASCQTVSGNTGKADYLSVASGTAPDGLFFATVDDGVATFVKNADLDKDGTTTYKVMAEGATVTLVRGESITLNETLKAATVSPVDAENDEIVKNENTYTCQAIPTATVSIKTTNASAIISVEDGATVKRGTVITVTDLTAADGYENAKATINGVDQDTYTVTGDEETIAIVVSATAIPVKSITLDITSTNVAPNDAFTLTATVLPADALDKTVIWSIVDDSDVVTIVPGGTTCEVTAAKAGNATVKAVAGDFEATCSVTVAAPGPIDWPDPSEYNNVPAKNIPGIKLPTELEDVDGETLITWAKNVGAVDFAAAETIKTEAFLLNIANSSDDAAIQAAKDAFKITAITIGSDGSVEITGPNAAKYNGAVTIEGKVTLDGNWGPKADDDKFFRATLTVKEIAE